MGAACSGRPACRGRAGVYVLAALAACVASVLGAAAGRCDDAELARRLLEWREDVPNVLIRVPLEVYDRFLKERLLPPEPPKAPENRIVYHAEYAVRIADDMLGLTLRTRTMVLGADAAAPGAVLPAGLAWQDVQVNGRPADLREDGPWLYLDDLDDYRPAQAGPFKLVVTARADLRARLSRGTHTAVLPVMPAAMSVLRVDSDGPWEVTTPRAVLSLTGTEEEGTHGTLALTAARDGQQPPNQKAGGDSKLEVTWRRPRPPVSRRGRPLYHCYLAWHLGEGFQEVRAVLDVRITGGTRNALDLRLPEGADRVKVTGPHVRAVNVRGGVAAVELKGDVTGATRLSMECVLPWPARRGRTSLNALDVGGGSLRGGTLIVTSDTGAVVLEEDSPGLDQVDLWEVPEQAAALTPAPPLLAWTIARNGWRANVDAVSLADLPVRETLVDEADHVVLLRPDGAAMHKVVFQVRNRNRQFLRVRLPRDDDRIVQVRVSDRPVTVSRAPDGRLLIPLDKSLETLESALRFTVELVFITRVDPLERRGSMAVPLARPDIPTAQARCTLYVPEGFDPDRWEGALRLAEGLTAVAQHMDYGRAHAAPAAPEQPIISSDVSSALLGDNYYRSIVEAYQKGDFERAEREGGRFMESYGEHARAGDVRNVMGNIKLMKGRSDARSKSERVMAEQLKQGAIAGQRTSEFEQKKLLKLGWENVRSGDEAAAAELFEAAEQAGAKLRFSRETAYKQDAQLAESQKWLGEHEAALKKNKELRQKLQQLRAEKEASARKDALERARLRADQELTPAGEPARPVEGLDRAKRAASTVTPGETPDDRDEDRRREADEEEREPEWKDAAEALPSGGRARRRAQVDARLPSGGPPPNVKAPGQLGTQRAAGKTFQTDEVSSLTLENLRLQEQITSGDKYDYEERQQTIDIDGDALLDMVTDSGVLKGFRAAPVAFDVKDLVRSEGEGGELATFMDSNYGTIRAQPRQPDAWDAGEAAGGRRVDYTEGKLIVRDRAAALRVADALSNLRRNKWQKVAVNTRELALGQDTIGQLDVDWNDMTGGAWAVVDEARLNALLELEQDAAGPGATVERGRFQIVPGTGQYLPNDATVRLQMARDDANTLVVNSGLVELPHEHVLLVFNNGRTVALRAGATQYWTEDPEAPEIRELPIEIHVPVVGTPVRLERMLVGPEDELMIRCTYSYREAQDAR